MQIPSALLLLWGLQLPPAGRAYHGPPAPEEPPVQQPASDAEPETRVETPTEPAEPPDGSTPVGEEAPEPAPAPNAADTTTAPEAARGELSLDDVFGTSGDHAGVEEVADPNAGDAQPKTRWAKVRDKVDFGVRILSSAYLDIHRQHLTDNGKVGFGRQENRVEAYVTVVPNRHIEIVGGAEMVFMGVAQTQQLDDLATRRLLTPFHFESDAAYVGLLDIAPGLDLKIGRQIVVWGAADLFNPTNNINPDDLEDRPLFTEPIANQMVVIDYAPLHDKLWFQGVYVPIFFPALLPPSASAALVDPRAPVPFYRDEDLEAIEILQAKLERDPTLVPHVVGHVANPDVRFANGQAAVKVGTSLGGVDFSASYYYGRHDIPTPIDVESTLVNPSDPYQYEDPDEAMDVLGEGCCFQSDVFLIYPRMQVVGLDFATQLPFAGDMGLWGEGALFLPEKQSMRIELPQATDITPDDDEVNPVSELTGPTIRSTPYVKVTAGLDYTAGKHVYLQGQYLRGFIDEFGVDHIGNYMVAGTDIIFFGRDFVVRLFGVVDFPTGPGDDPSGVIAPALVARPFGGFVQLELGSFVLLGKDRTKFGQTAAGTSIAYLKAIGRF